MTVISIIFIFLFTLLLQKAINDKGNKLRIVLILLISGLIMFSFILLHYALTGI